MRALVADAWLFRFYFFYCLGRIRFLDEAPLADNSQNGRNKGILNRRILSSLLFSLLAVVLAAGTVQNTAAQSSESQSKWKPVELKLPSGYMPAEFPEKRAGKLLLNPNKPAGMFIVYPKKGDSPDALPNLLKDMVAGMFFHESKSPVNWNEIKLPAHEGVDQETGTLYTAASDKMEIQLAVYTRTLGATTVLYGYYGMRHKEKKAKDDAAFIDSSGKGVEDFDKFWKSIRASK
jgi:hypothetical protein